MTVRPSVRSWTRAAIVALIPVVVTLAIFFGRTHLFPMGGDEPHYLIIADSLLSDFDLDLQNNYERDAKNPQIYGPIEPHVFRVGKGWMPYHGAGLPVLIALPFAVFGETGVRVALCVMTMLLPWTMMIWLSRDIGDPIATWLALGITLSVPIMFGSTQIYPDLMAGVVATSLALWLLIRGFDFRARRLWWAYWLLSGFLPWLNVKFIVPTLVLGMGGVAVLLGLRRKTESREYRVALATLPVFLCGPLALAGFHFWAFGNVLGLRGGSEITRSVARVCMIFAGLHLDQSQGMFVQQPLLLGGVAGLAYFARTHPRYALFWAALYASLIVPNSMELARYGLGGPAARFAWSAMWLWILPLGTLIAAWGKQCQGAVRVAVTVSVLYQAALSIRWLATPQVLFTAVNPPRDSLFPEVLRAWLPSFYTWDFSSYWRLPANQVALGLLAALVACGAFVPVRGSASIDRGV
jgi:hypothetical protein